MKDRLSLDKDNQTKIVLRDSGLLHALLGIETADGLYGHPVVGASWEGFVIEQLIGCIDDPSVDSSFYRTWPARK